MRDTCLGPFSGNWLALHMKSNSMCKPLATLQPSALHHMQALQETEKLQSHHSNEELQAILTATSNTRFSSMSWVRTCMLNDALRSRIISLKVKINTIQ